MYLIKSVVETVSLPDAVALGNDAIYSTDETRYN